MTHWGRGIFEGAPRATSRSTRCSACSVTAVGISLHASTATETLWNAGGARWPTYILVWQKGSQKISSEKKVRYVPRLTQAVFRRKILFAILNARRPPLAASLRSRQVIHNRRKIWPIFRLLVLLACFGSRAQNVDDWLKTT